MFDLRLTITESGITTKLTGVSFLDSEYQHNFLNLKHIIFVMNVEIEQNICIALAKLND